MHINDQALQRADSKQQLAVPENKQTQLLLKIKELVADLEMHTLQHLEEDIDRGYGVFNQKLVTLSCLSKIDDGLRLIDDGVKGLRENFVGESLLL